MLNIYVYEQGFTPGSNITTDIQIKKIYIIYLYV